MNLGQPRTLITTQKSFTSITNAIRVILARIKISPAKSANLTSLSELLLFSELPARRREASLEEKRENTCNIQENL